MVWTSIAPVIFISNSLARSSKDGWRLNIKVECQNLCFASSSIITVLSVLKNRSETFSSHEGHRIWSKLPSYIGELYGGIRTYQGSRHPRRRRKRCRRGLPPHTPNKRGLHSIGRYCPWKTPSASSQRRSSTRDMASGRSRHISPAHARRCVHWASPRPQAVYNIRSRGRDLMVDKKQYQRYVLFSAYLDSRRNGNILVPKSDFGRTNRNVPFFRDFKTKFKEEN